MSRFEVRDTVDADEPTVLYNAGCVYVTFGKYDEALTLLESTAHHGGLPRAWLHHDPDLDPLRSDARFEKLVNAVD